MIQIALCTDNNYAMPAGVMMCSVCKSTGPVTFHVIIPDDFTEINRNKLISVAKSYDSEVFFINIQDKFVDGFPVGLKDQPEHISIAAYYRLFLGELLPLSIEKVLYLDCDIVCMSSLQKLWDTDIEGYPIAGVQDVPYSGISEAIRLGYDEAKGYINSGVLLINLKYWRENNVSEKFVKCITECKDIIRYHDQDVLNLVFQGQIKDIDPKFNAQDRFFHKDTNKFPYTDEKVGIARRHPVIVHFTYKNKPWFLGGTHPYGKYFSEYKKLTPWKNTRLKPKKATNLKGLIANILVILGLYKYHDDYIDI